MNWSLQVENGEISWNISPQSITSMLHHSPPRPLWSSSAVLHSPRARCPSFPQRYGSGTRHQWAHSYIGNITNLSLSLSVGRDCPQPSHEDAPKNPNNTAMQVNCSHSWNALAIYMCVSLQNLSARIVWIHLSIKSDQSTHIKYEYQDFQHLLPDPSWFHHRRASA